MVGTPNTTLAGQSANYSRIVHTEGFIDSGFTNNISLTQARMTNPDSLNPVITHLMGMNSKKFPLLFLTEGQKGGVKYVEIQDVEYDWPVFGRMRKTDTVVGHDYPADALVGQGGLVIEVVFKTAWLKMHHNIVSPKGYRARISAKPERVSTGYKYRLQLHRKSDNDFLPLSEIAPNTMWAMYGGANVSESYSSGNESNKQTPGKVKNQIGILRKSYEIGGNVSQRTTNFQFNLGGSTTNYWLPFEEYQHECNFKQDVEESLWDSQYNRDSQGRITLIDEDTQLPIPMGAGIIEQIPNVDTYGILSASKITNTVSDATYGATDTDNMNLVMFTGKGGLREFSEAIMRDANKWTVFTGALNKTIEGSAQNLIYGAAFTQFRHIDGHVVTVKELPMLDFGGRAEVADKHPISGLPMTSYEMHFVDMSTYDGESNVKLVTQKGRGLIRGIEQGMALVKGANYGDYSGNSMDIKLATAQDRTAIHYLKTAGVAIRRNTHCFSLYCNLS